MACEEGDLDAHVVAFDGTELGELQRGFNSMVAGLREREQVRDLFGRHVGREVAAAAEQQMPTLGGEERHVAVLFVDVVGSTKLVSTRPAKEVVELLNRFFTVIVEEVDRHRGLVNKFEGDAALAIFGAPVSLENPENEALAATRAVARRLKIEVPECPARIGVAAGQVVAGNVGALEPFEDTAIAGPVHFAARLAEERGGRGGFERVGEPFGFVASVDEDGHKVHAGLQHEQREARAVRAVGHERAEGPVPVDDGAGAVRRAPG